MRQILAVAALAAAATSPWPQRASDVVHDRYDATFCHPHDADRTVRDTVAKLVAQKPPHKRCYARARNRTIVSHLLLNASEVRALNIDALPKHPTFWVPLRFATKADALDAICAFANATAPALQRAAHVVSWTLLTLPYPTGEHGSPWDSAYAKHGRQGCATALLSMLDKQSKLSAWFVMDHDSAVEDLRNSTRGQPQLVERWVARPKLRHVPMGVPRRAGPAFAAAFNSRAVPFHNRTGPLYVNFRVHGPDRAKASMVAHQHFGVKNAFGGGGDDKYFADLLRAPFVVSPRGSKIDCHRHWEALALGSAPVVLDSPLTRELFYGLPAILLDSWDDLTPDLLRGHGKVLRAVETHGGGFGWAKLSVDHWRTEVAEARPFAASCEDDRDWHHLGHDCAWVRAHAPWRCKVRGEDSSVAATACASACEEVCRASLRSDMGCRVRDLRCTGRIGLKCVYD